MINRSESRLIALEQRNQAARSLQKSSPDKPAATRKTTPKSRSAAR